MHLLVFQKAIYNPLKKVVTNVEVMDKNAEHCKHYTHNTHTHTTHTHTQHTHTQHTHTHACTHTCTHFPFVNFHISTIYVVNIASW